MTNGVLTTSEVDIRSALKPAFNSASRSQPISRFQEQEHLAQAHWHVSQIRTHIVRQRIRVKHARDTGQPSELEDSMLHALEASLYAFERHRDLIVSQLKRRFSE
jgi:AraC-like DNA-binding protein